MTTSASPVNPTPTSIDEGKKRFFDSVETLRQAAWQSFDRRRAFEWKLSFGLWTALALSIAGLVIGQAQLKSMPERLIVSGVALVVVLLHGWWSFYLHQVNDADLRKSYIYESEQRRALSMSDDSETAILKIVASMQGRKWYAKVWGHIVQVAITGILAAGGAALAWLR